MKRWRDEERRLYRLMKTFKERVRYSSDWAKKADAAETRWRRFSEPGPPPPPVADRSIVVQMPGGDSARRVLDLRGLAIDGPLAPFADEIHFGERVGVIGPNGSGKSELLRDGAVLSLPSYESALAVRRAPEAAHDVRLAKPLSVTAPRRRVFR